jgi:hypothetical protein
MFVGFVYDIVIACNLYVSLAFISVWMKRVNVDIFIAELLLDVIVLYGLR